MEALEIKNDLKSLEDFWYRLCFDPSLKPQGRLSVYRDLVFGALNEVIENICPVARSLFEQSEWEALIWEYLAKSPPKTHVLRALPKEAAGFFKSQDFSRRQDFPYLGELMEYEHAEVAVRFAPEDQQSTPSGYVRLNPAHFLGRYAWPVHFVSQELKEPSQLPQGQYALLLWREPKNLQVEFMEVNPLVEAFLTALAQPQKPASLLQQLAQSLQLPNTEQELFFSEGQELIKDWQQKGLLFGA